MVPEVLGATLSQFSFRGDKFTLYSFHLRYCGWEWTVLRRFSEVAALYEAVKGAAPTAASGLLHAGSGWLPLPLPPRKKFLFGLFNADFLVGCVACVCVCVARAPRGGGTDSPLCSMSRLAVLPVMWWREVWVKTCPRIQDCPPCNAPVPHRPHWPLPRLIPHLGDLVHARVQPARCVL
jgi:hypothetical protein